MCLSLLKMENKAVLRVMRQLSPTSRLMVSKTRDWNINDRVSGSASRHEIEQLFGMPVTVPAGRQSAKPLLCAHTVSGSLEEMALREL